MSTISQSRVRCVLLTGDKTRHKYVASVLAQSVDLIGIVSEAKSSLSTPMEVDQTPSNDQAVIDRHFAEMREAEARYFGEMSAFPLDDSALFATEPGTINHRAVFDWIRSRRPDMLLLYGTSIVKEPLLSAYGDRIINMHLGLSPYYRGSATNFWPLVFEEPECVGVTIHLAVSKLDAGPILRQGRPSIRACDGSHDLGCKTIIRGAELLASCAADWRDRQLEPVPQDIKNGRLCRRGDFNADAVRRMWCNLASGMMSSYIASAPERQARFPIIS